MATNVFDLLDVSPNDCPRHFVNNCQGDLLLIGGGRSLWDDTRGLPEPSNTMCVNDVGMYWPGKITHWYSNEIDQLIHWSKGRRRPYKIYGGSGNLHSATKRGGDPQYQHVNFWPFPTQGSSGLVALYVALAMGYDPITVVGMPWDDSGHFFDPPELHNLRRPDGWSHFSTETPEPYLERIAPLCRGRVNVISGRLKRILEG